MAAASPRYETILRLASGGMATVWVGTVRGALGFRQLVAIKKPHPHLLADPMFRGELVAEARLASMIRHANVVDVRDVEIDGESISLVMDFIEGASLGELLVAASKRSAPEPKHIPARVAVRIVRDACAGLHAAHELVDERDRPVGLVHRDVSPQNVLVGTDGISRVTDFGVAKFARKNAQSTSEGSLKGKLAYMAPEYVRGEEIDRRFDVFAMGVVLWEALTGRRCFRGDNEAETVRRLLDHVPEPVSVVVGDPSLEPLDSIVACAFAKNRDERFQNAAAMGAALEGAATAAGLLGSHTEVAATLKELVGSSIEERRTQVRAKLAHEPSVASLMGMPADAIPDLSPPAEQSLPAKTPKMKDGPATTEMAPTVTAVANTTLPMAANVAPVGTANNATLPVATPLMANAPFTAQAHQPTVPSPVMPITLASPGTQAQAQAVAVHTSSPPMSTLHSLSDQPAAPVSAHTHDDLPVAPPRRSLAPFVIGVVVVALAVTLLVVIVAKKKANDPTALPTASATTASATATSVTTASASSVPTTPEPTTTSASTAAATTTATPTTPTRKGTKPTPAPPSPSTAAPLPTPPTPSASSTNKKPPPNPYE